MKQLTRQEVEAVVERLGGKAYSPEGWFKYYKRIEIGNVLEKIVVQFEPYLVYSNEDDYGYIEELVQLWQPLGLSRSLQEIVETSGWNEHVECNICGDPCSTICSNGTILRYEILQSPEANALFSFLLQIGL